jgi:polyvinyl alcohol dehydrogenase (cytochrome)
VLWSRPISGYTGVAGDVSRVSPAVYGSDIILGSRVDHQPDPGRRQGIRRHTGALDWITQVDIDPATVITSAPVIHNGVAYLGISSKGEAGTGYIPRRA